MPSWFNTRAVSRSFAPRRPSASASASRRSVSASVYAAASMARLPASRSARTVNRVAFLGRLGPSALGSWPADSTLAVTARATPHSRVIGRQDERLIRHVSTASLLKLLVGAECRHPWQGLPEHADAFCQGAANG